MAEGGGRGQLQIRGAAELRRTLRRAGADLRDLTAINRAAANVVLPVAKSSAPTGPAAGGHIKTTLRVAATQRRGEVRAGNRSKPYGPILQYGWRARGIAPHNWVIEAAKETEPTWVALYERRVMELINNVQGA